MKNKIIETKGNDFQGMNSFHISLVKANKQQLEQMLIEIQREINLKCKRGVWK